jgi:hypothetical protein
MNVAIVKGALALAIWVVVLGVLFWTYSSVSTTSAGPSSKISTVSTLACPTGLSMTIESVTPMEASIGTNIVVLSKGWEQGQSVSVEIFNPSTGQYLFGSLYGGTVNVNSSGTASISLKVTPAMAGKNGALPNTVQIYASASNAKSCGYNDTQTPRIGFVVTG